MDGVPDIGAGRDGGSGSCNTVLQLCPHWLGSVPALPALRRRLSCLGVRSGVPARCHPCWRVVCAPVSRRRCGRHRGSGPSRPCRSMQAPRLRCLAFAGVLTGVSCSVGSGVCARRPAGASCVPSGDRLPVFARWSVWVAVSSDRIFGRSCAMPCVAHGLRDEAVASRSSGSASALLEQHRRL